MTRPLKDSVVVITGASSGIGRAAAIQFARERAALVLAARREDILKQVARECELKGSETLVVQTDVTDEEQVEKLGREALERFGRIDVWVNNAGVTAFGRFEEMPMDIHRRVLETNLFGYIYGARAALKAFREQGAGVLINNGSMVAKVPEPYVSSYVISKHAIRGLGASLRQELAVEGAEDIHVSTVLPATIDTPFFQHAANFTGRATKAMPPVYPAEQVAKAIVECARKPRREVFVGNSGRMLNLQQTLAPGRTERMVANMVDRKHLYKNKPQEHAPGNLFEPMDEGTGVSGGWNTPDGAHVSDVGANSGQPAKMRKALLGGAVAAPLLLWAWKSGKLSELRD